MKKIILISAGIIFVILIILILAAIIISFTIVKPTTEEINRKLVQKFSAIVRIPQGIQPPLYEFNQTSYFWEMETIEKEVTGVKFRFNTGFPPNQQKLEAVLEMPEGSDPSIFHKVLPAIIGDKQSLDSVQNIEMANLGANEEASYSQIKIFIVPNSTKIGKINWEFEKSNLGEDLFGLYSKLNYPESVLKFLYGLPHLILSLLSA